MLAILKFLWKKTAAAAVCAFTAVSLAVISFPFFLPLSDFSFAGNGGGKGGAEREYALYSASSSAAFDTNPSLYEVLFIRGETVIFRNKNQVESEKIKEAAIGKYKASVRFAETAGGKTSYYCYSPKIGEAKAKTIGGEKINLHIVTGEGEVRIGSPVVCGGY